MNLLLMSICVLLFAGRAKDLFALDWQLTCHRSEYGLPSIMGFGSQLIPSFAETSHAICLLMLAKEKCAIALTRSVIAIAMAIIDHIVISARNACGKYERRRIMALCCRCRDDIVGIGLPKPCETQREANHSSYAMGRVQAGGSRW